MGAATVVVVLGEGVDAAVVEVAGGVVPWHPARLAIRMVMAKPCVCAIALGTLVDDKRWFMDF
jgi:hypothetical protein